MTNSIGGPGWTTTDVLLSKILTVLAEIRDVLIESQKPRRVLHFQEQGPVVPSSEIFGKVPE